MSHLTRKEAIERIRKALKARSGKAWSVTGGTGTAYGWITIQAPPARRVGDYGYTSGEECDELARLLGVRSVHCQGESISPDSRAFYVERAEKGEPPAGEATDEVRYVREISRRHHELEA